MKGAVLKNEILAVYRGKLSTCNDDSDSSQNDQSESDYVIDFKDKSGKMYRLDGKNEEQISGSIGHIVNSIVGIEDSTYNAYFEYSPTHKAFLVRASYEWDSGKTHLNLCF